MKKNLLLILSLTSIGASLSWIHSARAQSEWKAEYSGFIRQKMENYPELVDQLSPLHVSGICSNWGNLKHSQRIEFWVNFIRATAYAETGWNPRLMTLEPRNPDTYQYRKDNLTGKPVVSEGMMQISYGSAKAYGCDLDYDQDKATFLKDYNNYIGSLPKKFRSKNYTGYNPSYKGSSSRDILNAKKNIGCSIEIFNSNFKVALRDDNTNVYHTANDGSKIAIPTIIRGIGRYWGSVRPGRTGFKHLMDKFLSTNKDCVVTARAKQLAQVVKKKPASKPAKKPAPKSPKKS